MRWNDVSHKIGPADHWDRRRLLRTPADYRSQLNLPELPTFLADYTTNTLGGWSYKQLRLPLGAGPSPLPGVINYNAKDSQVTVANVIVGWQDKSHANFWDATMPMICTWYHSFFAGDRNGDGVNRCTDGNYYGPAVNHETKADSHSWFCRNDDCGARRRLSIALLPWRAWL
jgi:hypothetical protein